MKVQIVATKACSHRPNLERELRDLGIGYELMFVEEHPEAALKLGIRHSPVLVVDDCVVFQGQPSEGDLRNFFSHAGTR